MNNSGTRKIFLVLSVVYTCLSVAQEKNFSVVKVSFSSAINDEFAPVFYKNGLVYCSNSLSNTSIQSEEGRLFNIVYVQEKDSGNWKSPELFSKEITTILNEGPATFSKDMSIIYFARNNLVEGKFKDINNLSNTMGIYSAEKVDGIWQNIKSFPYNSSEYSLGTPSLNEANTRLYYASDMPGGYGGTDIYYSDYVSGKWGSPINLGSHVNTSSNESYPFASSDGKIFFSSDGRGGFGGKDIFYTVEKSSGFLPPIHLANDINSSSDDYGLITDANLELGFFSSNRNNSDDIFSFKSEMPQFGYCDTIKFPLQCFAFFDDRFTDTLHLKYEWTFGNGIKKYGYLVEHCYDQPGNYEVLLTITHQLADSVYQTKTIHRFAVNTSKNAYFLSPEFSSKGRTIDLLGVFDTFNQFEVEEVFWDFGNGYKKMGLDIRHNFEEIGTSMISLGLSGKKDSYGQIPRTCFTKEIEIVEDMQLYANRIEAKTEKKTNKSFQKITENTRRPEESYNIKYLLLSDNISLLEVDKLEHQLKSYTDVRIESNGSLEISSRNSITQIAKFLLPYSKEELTVAVHSSNKGSSRSNQELTERLGQEIKQIFIDNGFPADNLQAFGYGAARPKFDWKDKKTRSLNQRVEFIITAKSEMKDGRAD